MAICPLLLASSITLPDPREAFSKQALHSSCLKNKCAWFFQSEGQEEGKGMCAISKIASKLLRS